MSKIARINYLNTTPFFYHWNDQLFPLTSGTPRDLALAAKDGDISAGPLPLVECWNLEHRYSPLGFWGIATRKASGSVLLLSKQPISDLHDVTIGVTRESSTSVMLLDVLINQKYNHRVRLKRGLQPTDDAWLVIGDQAFQIWVTQKFGSWTHVADLASEWWNWKKLPFVFARWIVNNATTPQQRSILTHEIHSRLKAGLYSFIAISEKYSPQFNVPPEKIIEYLNGFTYVLSKEEEEGIRVFRQLVEKTGPVLFSLRT